MAQLLADKNQDVELWIRPDRTGVGYAVEWTTLDYAAAAGNGQPHQPRSLLNITRLGQRASQLLTHIISNIRTRMPTFDVDQEQINLFAVEDRYLFKHYFKQDDVFAALRDYYNADDYRFEVPDDAVETVQEVLEDHFFEAVIIHDLELFCVVYPKYQDHPSVLFKASVLQRSTDDAHIFLMKDKLSVEQAINQGATAFADADVDGSFP